MQDNARAVGAAGALLPRRGARGAPHRQVRADARAPRPRVSRAAHGDRHHNAAAGGGACGVSDTVCTSTLLVCLLIIMDAVSAACVACRYVCPRFDGIARRVCFLCFLMWWTCGV